LIIYIFFLRLFLYDNDNYVELDNLKMNLVNEFIE